MLSQAEITENKKKNKISESCFEGLAAHAGYAIHKTPLEDDYGTDYAVQNLVFRDDRRRDYGVAVHFQLKGTTNWEDDGSNILYPLEVKAFNDMAGRKINNLTPIILVLMCLCKTDPWICVNPNDIVLKRHLLWWVSDATTLSNLSENSKIEIVVPKTNILNEAALTTLVNQYRPRVI